MKNPAQFDWPTAFLPITPEPEFCQTGIGGEISKTILLSFYNLGLNILEPYNVLIQTRLTTSKRKRDI